MSLIISFLFKISLIISFLVKNYILNIFVSIIWQLKVMELWIRINFSLILLDLLTIMITNPMEQMIKVFDINCISAM